MKFFIVSYMYKIGVQTAINRMSVFYAYIAYDIEVRASFNVVHLSTPLLLSSVKWNERRDDI